jgi:hypothetical protein
LQPQLEVRSELQPVRKPRGAKLDTSGGAEISPTDVWKSKCGVGAKIAIRDCMSF